MANYVLKRIFQGLISILGATAIIFAISRLDDPTLLMLPIDATPDHIEHVCARSWASTCRCCSNTGSF